MKKDTAQRIQEIREDYKCPWIRIIDWPDSVVTGWPFQTREAARADARKNRERYGMTANEVYVVRG